VNLSANEDTYYVLWKCTKNLKKPLLLIPPVGTENGGWPRSDHEEVETFAKHLVKVFQPYEGQTTPDEETKYQPQLQSSLQVSPPIERFSPGEIMETIKNLNPKKAPGFDLITGTLLKELPRKAIIFIRALFNDVIRIGYSPIKLTIAQLMVILKPSKPSEEVTSYRPISLLKIISKLFEKRLLTRLKTILGENISYLTTNSDFEINMRPLNRSIW
jgi:hypothetical protein